MMKKYYQTITEILTMGLFLLLMAGCSKGARVDRLLKDADEDFSAGKYDNAEIEYKKVLALQLNGQAIGQLGRIFAQEGRITEAHLYLVKAAEMLPNSLAFQLALGQVDLSFREFTNSAKIAARILTAQPGNEDALRLLCDCAPTPQLDQMLHGAGAVSGNPAYQCALGLLEFRNKNLVAAEKDLRAAITAHPKSSQDYFALAQFYASQKRDKEGLAMLKMAYDLAPIRSPISLRYIDFLIKTGQIESARQALQNITEKAPDYVPAWITLMDMALAQKKFDDATKFSQTVLNRDEHNYEALLGHGTAALGKGDAAAAVQEFQRMETLYRKSPQVKYDLAASQLSAREKSQAVASLIAALALNPEFSPAVMLLAQVQISNGDPASAVLVLTRYLKKYPSAPDANLLLAEAYMAKKLPDNALAIYRTLETASPKNPQFPILSGIVLAGVGKNSAARVEFQKALTLSPGYPQAVQQLINLDLSERQFGEASALAQQEIERYPKAAEPWEILAKINFAQSNVSGTISALQKAISINPASAGAHMLLAEAYSSTGKYTDALRELNDFVSRTNDAGAYVQIGSIQENLKDYKAARDAYQQAISLQPDLIPALNNLAYIDAEFLNKLDEANDMAQKARQLAPADANVEDTLGYVLIKKGDYPRAITVLNDSAEKFPAVPEIQYHLGLAHYLMADAAGAHPPLQRAVAAKQDYAHKADARHRLAMLDMDVRGGGPAVQAALEQELRNNPDDPIVLARLGSLQESQGNWADAADIFAKAHKQNPNVVTFAIELAKIDAYHLDKPDKAYDLARAAHDAAPDNAEIGGLLGHLVLQNGDYTGALNLLETAAQRLPDDPQLDYDLARVYYSGGRVAEALTAMQKALQGGANAPWAAAARQFIVLTQAMNDPAQAQTQAAAAGAVLSTNENDVPALMLSGLAQERAGDFTSAQKSFTKALTIYPQFVPASRQLAELDAAHFPQEAAGYAQAEKARTAYPTDPAVAKSLGLLAYAQGKYSRSAQALEDSVSQTPGSAEVYFYLGMDYSQLKRANDSRQALGRALALSSQTNPSLSPTQMSEAQKTLASLK